MRETAGTLSDAAPYPPLENPGTRFEGKMKMPSININTNITTNMDTMSNLCETRMDTNITNITTNMDTIICM